MRRRHPSALRGNDASRQQPAGVNTTALDAPASHWLRYRQEAAHRRCPKWSCEWQLSDPSSCLAGPRQLADLALESLRDGAEPLEAVGPSTPRLPPKATGSLLTIACGPRVTRSLALGLTRVLL